MQRLRTPITYYGGKGAIVSKLLKFIPPHKHYVEVFGGGASLLMAKESCGGVEVYNDIDEDLTNFFRVIRDPELFGRFYHYIIFTPYSRAEFTYCKNNFKESDDIVIKAYRYYVKQRMSFGGGGEEKGWSFSVGAVCKNMSKSNSAWLSMIEMLPFIHERIMKTQIECRDWRFILKTYNAPDTFMYLDPPYVPSTLRHNLPYQMMTENEHKELIGVLLECPQMIMLSGYLNPIYDVLIKNGWRKEEFNVACHAAGNTRYTGIQGVGSALEKQPRIEVIWMNYDKDGKLLKSNKVKIKKRRLNNALGTCVS